MLEYIYFVKCPNCEDEHFDFFDEAKAFALGCLSQKPVITQIEVCRNDFGECTDSSDLGTIWSWEDECKECSLDAEKAGSHILTKADLENIPERDPEFDTLDNSVDFEPEISEVSAIDEKSSELGLQLLKEFLSSKGLLTESNFRDNMSLNEFLKAFKRLCDKIGLKTIDDVQYFMSNIKYPGNLLDKLEAYALELDELDEAAGESCRKPVPDGMTIEQLVEEMEENEDEVECTWCNDLFPKDQCRKEVDLGYLCPRCEAAIKSRGEKLTFVENDYWDFLDEEVEKSVVEDISEATQDIPADYDFFNEDFDEPVEEEEVEESIFADAESVEEVAEILIKEEEKAIDQYEEAADKIEELASEEVLEDTKEILDHIKEEEKEHIEELEDLLPEEDAEGDLLNDASDSLEEASLSDIARAANREFGSNINSKDILDRAGVEDTDYFGDLDTYPSVNKKSSLTNKRLRSVYKMMDCPECGAEKTLDPETGICNNCGFIL